ncbi:winged helix-turn-helix transcriptional regulator [Fructobacillus sp. M2-14]|uniref:Winged helix-turn-helix transcriptional regulator n=1 Tax=Fructobacillus broussonetiae TaxID=2713173 RepID=A0ABS5QY37_9LACO|nr:MarR family winged helix-turn-helix transcriptional regulator [Fructobacillus broussonetiae]MBS9338121.1 winged helix-turn-helix transcriptional regulator [Fructobacillus broussonetiae]
MTKSHEELINDYQHSTSQSFFALYTDWFRQTKSQLRRLNLTHPQVQVLATVEKLNLEAPEVTQAMVAKEADIDPMTASAIITKLAREDFLDRFPGKKNPRSKAIRLTQHGKNNLEKALIVMNDFDKAYWKDTNPNRQELIANFKKKI